MGRQIGNRVRNHVTFGHPAEFVPLSDADDILGVRGAQWFIPLLKGVPRLQIDEDLCQEDWGVVIFAQRDRKKFWIGLSCWPDGENAWLAHFHHGSFAWLQPFASSGKSALKNLVLDFHEALKKEPAISNVVWYEESQMNKASPDGFATPGDGD